MERIPRLSAGTPQMAESLGVAPPGEGARFFAKGRMSFGGDIAWSTIGDAPGRGHTGSGWARRPTWRPLAS